MLSLLFLCSSSLTFFFSSPKESLFCFPVSISGFAIFLSLSSLDSLYKSTIHFPSPFSSFSSFCFLPYLPPVFLSLFFSSKPAFFFSPHEYLAPPFFCCSSPISPSSSLFKSLSTSLFSFRLPSFPLFWFCFFSFSLFVFSFFLFWFLPLFLSSFLFFFIFKRFSLLKKNNNNNKKIIK